MTELVESSELVRAIERRDIHGVAWAVLGKAATDEAPNGSLISALIRVLASLGPAPADEEMILKETALRGLIMAGLTPRTDAEWELAERVFDDDAIADLRQRAATGRQWT